MVWQKFQRIAINSEFDTNKISEIFMKLRERDNISEIQSVFAKKNGLSDMYEHEKVV